MFDRYARLISDARDLKSLRSLYIVKNVLFILAIIMLISASGCMISLSEYPETASEPPVFWAAFFCVIFLFLFAFAFIILQIVFGSTIKRISNAPVRSGENELIADYRRKYAQVANADKKRKSIPWIVLIVSIVLFMILIVVDVVVNYSREDFTPLTISATVILCLGIITFIFIFSFNQVKKNSRGDSLAVSTEKEAAAIDAAQGRKTKYKPANDKNLQSLDYLFPDPEIRTEAEAIRKKFYKFAFIGFIVGFLLTLIVSTVFLSGFVFKIKLVGYIYPVLTFLMLGCALLFVVPSNRQMIKAENKQYAQMKENPDLSDNLEIFEAYKKHSKTWGRAALYSFIPTLISGLALAIVYPDKMYSIFGFVFTVIGLIINNKAVADLRKKVKPIEERIDEKNIIGQSAKTEGFRNEETEGYRDEETEWRRNEDDEYPENLPRDRSESPKDCDTHNREDNFKDGI